MLKQLKELIEKEGISPRLRDNKGLTVLMHAAQSYGEYGHGRAAAVEYLLDVCKVNVDDTTDSGRSALHFAAEKNNADAVTVLLARGADSNKDAGGKTPLLLSVHEEPRAMRALIVHGRPDLKAVVDEEGVPATALYQAVTHFRDYTWKAALLLVQAGADTELKRPWGPPSWSSGTTTSATTWRTTLPTYAPRRCTSGAAPAR